MLTKELLTANVKLNGLSEDQINAIITLSANDESVVIAKKTGEIYGGLDNDILSVSGVAKASAEKTYEYAKRVLTEFKTKSESANGLQKQVDDLTKEKTRLEKVIADGGNDGETAKQLKQTKADLAAVTQQFNELNTKYQNAENTHKQQLLGVKIESELNAALSGMKFKANYSDEVVKVITKQAAEKIKSLNPEYIDDGKGGQTLVFKGQNGEIMRNAANQLNPYTAAELMAKELDTLGVLDKGRQQSGGGTGGSGGGNSNVFSLDGIRTKGEAYTAIHKSLVSQGLVVGTNAYQTAFDKVWVDNKISELPNE